MFRTLCVTLTFVALAVPAQAGAEAVDITVSLRKPVISDPDAVVLRGVVGGRREVVLQRLVGRKWRKVTRLTASSRGAFRTTVTRRQQPQWFRVTAGHHASRARRVPAAAPPAVVESPVVESPVVGPVEPVRTPLEPGLEPEVSECGPAPRKPDGTPWVCTLADDFDGTELDRSLWLPQTARFVMGSDSGRPCYVDDPSTVAVRDGALHLSVIETSKNLSCPQLAPLLPTRHLAGSVSTYYKFSQQYGRFEARIKATASSAPGLQEAFWLWPDARDASTVLWPAAGEIDISETYSQYPSLSVPFLHYTANDNGGPVPGLNTAWNCVAHRGVWNVYTLEWTATRIEITVNGKSCLINESADPAFAKRYIVAFTAGLGQGANAYDGRAPLPATMSIDYLRVWE